MTFTVDISSDINRIAKDFDSMQKKQLPFAINLTLNKLAAEAQECVISRIERVFQNSNRWYDRRQRTGIKVSFAAKDNLVASVYTKAHFAHIQEEGGIKTAYHGGNIAIPTCHIPKKQRSSKALRAMQGDKSIFKSGSSIFRRVSNQKLQKLYTLSGQAKIIARMQLKQTAINGFNKGFDRVFTDKFNLAMKGVL